MNQWLISVICFLPSKYTHDIRNIHIQAANFAAKNELFSRGVYLTSLNPPLQTDITDEAKKGFVACKSLEDLTGRTSFTIFLSHKASSPLHPLQ